MKKKRCIITVEYEVDLVDSPNPEDLDRDAVLTVRNAVRCMNFPNGRVIGQPKILFIESNDGKVLIGKFYDSCESNETKKPV